MRFPTLAGADLSFNRGGADLRTPQQHYSEQLLIARLQEERHEHMARIRHLRDAHEAVDRENGRLRDALIRAAEDLGKASNQFAALLPGGNNWRIFEKKAMDAELAVAGDREAGRA